MPPCSKAATLAESTIFRSIFVVKALCGLDQGTGLLNSVLGRMEGSEEDRLSFEQGCRIPSLAVTVLYVLDLK